MKKTLLAATSLLALFAFGAHASESAKTDAKPEAATEEAAKAAEGAEAAKAAPAAGEEHKDEKKADHK
jgi:hypothetical protein